MELISTSRSVDDSRFLHDRIILFAQASFAFYHLIVRPDVSTSMYIIGVLQNWGEVGVCICLVILTWIDNEKVQAAMLALNFAVLALLMIYVFVLIGSVVMAMASRRKKDAGAQSAAGEIGFTAAGG